VYSTHIALYNAADPLYGRLINFHHDDDDDEDDDDGDDPCWLKVMQR